ncbi:similar to Saccharomyces cerevisiae YKL073W LHS1 Molecular chaperone of the endoplasmic reticulum lumen, involved in polypeptide translocation and folding [Maudiozyma barnettii]|uniref:Similar to Saccharomyces cerevisiae YKL073W LHS1 Molecular chaperone of the endoplasmic reticulum lumen, involved in polypeptide translocation and folding n=1 Tax=Maudiozyma barnettii TaxID=61262 RepID=A0A8H2ZLS2_9SACH|nr:Hsp70 family chaperone LHS1 [Kazachstania barnettii]CAB4256372.1 similar to Saccharomyces cerevisiae YKL073W LHS1 Molecular chaperone of the endoplasmic reticulum lumen, involved in polypeptide translocation and folding [Kazachstania barnettii]CAD1784981.1 similar to Saccharomyces cerevisiae YKL073W LHS1 Molecular chaperone of the endoplasmic reticulum lumen, involved in polypeptide translocation and folding [Kazachstania barnettii]
MVRVWKSVSLLPVWLLLISHTFAALLAVDYGQQFIKAMVVSPQAPLEMVLTPEAKRKEVSGMAFKKLSKKATDIERFYGSAVGSLATRFPGSTMLHLKPLLGRSIDDLEVVEYQKEHPGLELVSTSRKSVAIKIGKVKYPVEELVAMNLQEITARANKHIKENDKRSKDYVEKLALSIPAYWDQYQRTALMGAGMFVDDLTGLTLIDDGLTIAVNFAVKKNDFELDQPHHYVIYDMGSGSIKASLVTITQDAEKDVPIKIELQGYGFNSTLGGSQLTMRVANLIKSKFLEKNPKVTEEDLDADARATAKIIQAAEKAKLVLSANGESSVSIESVLPDVDFRTVISREEFENAMEEDIKSFSLPILDAIEKQFNVNSNEHITLDDITGIILAGGSSRVPFVQKSLADVFGSEKLLKTVNADESIVNGLSLRGTQLFQLFKTRPFSVTDRSVFNFTLHPQDEESNDIQIFEAGSSFPNKRGVLVPIKDASETSVYSIYENDRIIKNMTIEGIENFTLAECPFGSVYNMSYALTQVRTLNIETIDCFCIKDAKEARSVKKEILGMSYIEDVDEDDEFESFDSEETDDFHFDVDAKKEAGLMISPAVRSYDDYVMPMSNEERMESTNRIQMLDENDKRRFQLQEAKNLLESSLYDIRNFLSEEEILRDGPTKQIEKLSRLVTEYLDWVEYEADTAAKNEINKRRKEISSMKKSIDEYLETAAEPLGYEQLQNILDTANGLWEKIEHNADNLEEKLAELDSKLDKKILDVRKEYSQIKVPSYLAQTIRDYNTTINIFEESIANMTSFVEQKIFEKMDREQLYGVKTMFENLIKAAQDKFTALETVQSQRLADLKATYQRKIRSLKRKEKKKQQAESSKSMASDTSASASNDKKSSTSNKSTETTDVHDEL